MPSSLADLCVRAMRTKLLSASLPELAQQLQTPLTSPGILMRTHPQDPIDTLLRRDILALLATRVACWFGGYSCGDFIRGMVSGKAWADLRIYFSSDQHALQFQAVLPTVLRQLLEARAGAVCYRSAAYHHLNRGVRRL